MIAIQRPNSLADRISQLPTIGVLYLPVPSGKRASDYQSELGSYIRRTGLVGRVTQERIIGVSPKDCSAVDLICLTYKE